MKKKTLLHLINAAYGLALQNEIKLKNSENISENIRDYTLARGKRIAFESIITAVRDNADNITF